MIPDSEEAVRAATHNIIGLAIKSIDVTAMTDPHFSIDCEIVLFVRPGPEDHLAVPESCSDPKLTLTLDELDTANLLVSARESVNNATTFRVSDKCFSNLVSNGYQVALLVNVTCCDTLFHRDLKGDISIVILDAPESDQVLSVDSRKEVRIFGCFVR